MKPYISQAIWPALINMLTIYHLPHVTVWRHDKVDNSRRDAARSRETGSYLTDQNIFETAQQRNGLRNETCGGSEVTRSHAGDYRYAVGSLYQRGTCRQEEI